MVLILVVVAKEVSSWRKQKNEILGSTNVLRGQKEEEVRVTMRRMSGKEISRKLALPN